MGGEDFQSVGVGQGVGQWRMQGEEVEGIGIKNERLLALPGMGNQAGKQIMGERIRAHAATRCPGVERRLRKNIRAASKHDFRIPGNPRRGQGVLTKGGIYPSATRQ